MEGQCLQGKTTVIKREPNANKEIGREQREGGRGVEGGRGFEAGREASQRIGRYLRGREGREEGEKGRGVEVKAKAVREMKEGRPRASRRRGRGPIGP